MTDLATARIERETGMAAALDHAESEVPDWAAVALAFVHKYARSHRQFIAEDCIEAAVEWGLAVPVPKAFGPVFRSAARVGIVTKIGYVQSARRHLSPTPLWSSNVFKDPQI